VLLRRELAVYPMSMWLDHLHMVTVVQGMSHGRVLKGFTAAGCVLPSCCTGATNMVTTEWVACVD
jgi:hypothetical protein